MPHFTVSFERNTLIIQVVVGQSHAVPRALQHHSEGLPRSVRLQALIDTGAERTCIDSTVVSLLRLQPTGLVRLQTSSTGQQPVLASSCDVSLLLPHPDGMESALTLPILRVSAIDLSSEPFKVLLGRDVLKYCVMTYNGGKGWITVAY